MALQFPLKKIKQQNKTTVFLCVFWCFLNKNIKCGKQSKISVRMNWRSYDVFINLSHFKVFTRVVPVFSIVMHGEFSRRSVKKKTGAEVFSDA